MYSASLTPTLTDPIPIYTIERYLIFLLSFILFVTETADGSVPEPASVVWPGRLSPGLICAAPCGGRPLSSPPAYTEAAASLSAGSPPPVTAPYQSAYQRPECRHKRIFKLNMLCQSAICVEVKLRSVMIQSVG